MKQYHFGHDTPEQELARQYVDTYLPLSSAAIPVKAAHPAASAPRSHTYSYAQHKSGHGVNGDSNSARLLARSTTRHNQDPPPPCPQRRTQKAAMRTPWEPSTSQPAQRLHHTQRSPIAPHLIHKPPDLFSNNSRSTTPTVSKVYCSSLIGNSKFTVHLPDMSINLSQLYSASGKTLDEERFFAVGARKRDGYWYVPFDQGITACESLGLTHLKPQFERIRFAFLASRCKS